MSDAIKKILNGMRITKAPKPREYVPSAKAKAFIIPMTAAATTATIGGIINNMFLNSRLNSGAVEGAYVSPDEQSNIKPQSLIIIRQPLKK